MESSSYEDSGPLHDVVRVGRENGSHEIYPHQPVRVDWHFFPVHILELTISMVGAIFISIGSSTLSRL